MIDPFVVLAPILVLAVIALLGFVGCKAFTEAPGPNEPTFIPPPGIYTTEQWVALSPTSPGTEVWFTTDGSNPIPPPGGSGEKFGPSIKVSSTTTIRAVAVGVGGYSASAIVDGIYIILPPKEVALDAVSNSPPNVGQSQSWLHTASGTNRLLVVVVHGNTQARRVISVTYGGTPLTYKDRIDGGPTTYAWVEIWYLTAPATGAQTITVTLDAPDTVNWTATSISFTNVDQTTPLGTSITAIGTDAAPTVNVSSAANNLVVSSVTYDDVGGKILTVGAGQTPQRGGVVTGQVGFGVSTAPGAATVAMSWVLSGARPWRIMGVSVKAAT